MARTRTVFVCRECRFTTTRPLGRCPECGAWESLGAAAADGAAAAPSVARPLAAAAEAGAPRRETGLGELDRVLGGGLVGGALVLLGGDPGVGKSTLLLHALDGLARPGPALYASGEESLEQTALRARRLGVTAPGLLVLAETRLAPILEQAAALHPTVVVLDSVQTLKVDGVDGLPGSPAQVRAAAAAVQAFAKGRGVPVILVGHVTKDGALAGPKTLEHLVDVVLHFEGEATSSYRVLRATKNRFGATTEVGVFEMRAAGLREVPNPSALFLAERPVGVPGSGVAAAVAGTRPLLVEVQALVAPAAGVPRRAVVGADPFRVPLLLAVVERRAGIAVCARDVFVNVAGGLQLGEPACDLPLLAAVASAACGQPLDPGAVCFGEVGLAGEVRAAANAELRLAEAARLGFSRCVLPERCRAALTAPAGLELIGVRDVGTALRALLGPASRGAAEAPAPAPAAVTAALAARA